MCHIEISFTLENVLLLFLQPRAIESILGNTPTPIVTSRRLVELALLLQPIKIGGVQSGRHRQINAATCLQLLPRLSARGASGQFREGGARSLPPVT